MLHAGVADRQDPFVSEQVLAISPTGVLPSEILLRKEVIQPQVPLRLPCYDFIPVTNHTLGVSLR